MRDGVSILRNQTFSQFKQLTRINNQSAEGAGGLGIIRSDKVGETE